MANASMASARALELVDERFGHFVDLVARITSAAQEMIAEHTAAGDMPAWTISPEGAEMRSALAAVVSASAHIGKGIDATIALVDAAADELPDWTGDPRMGPYAGTSVAVRCGKCGRRFAPWGPDEGFLGVLGPPPTHGVTVSYEPDPKFEGVHPGRVVLRCHPKRCGAVYPLRAATIFSLLLKAVDAGQSEIRLA